MVATMDEKSKLRLGEIIKKARGNQTLTVFGKSLNVSYNAISNWEKGLFMPDRKNLQKIAVQTGFTLDELIEYLEGEKPKPSPLDAIIKEIRDMEFKQLAILDRAVADRFCAIAESVG